MAEWLALPTLVHGVTGVSGLALEESKMHSFRASLEFSELFSLKSTYVKYNKKSYNVLKHDNGRYF